MAQRGWAHWHPPKHIQHIRARVTALAVGQRSVAVLAVGGAPAQLVDGRPTGYTHGSGIGSPIFGLPS